MNFFLKLYGKVLNITIECVDIVNDSVYTIFNCKQFASRFFCIDGRPSLVWRLKRMVWIINGMMEHQVWVP